MKSALLTLTFIFSSAFLVSFFSIDACMDAGGQWSNFGISCKGARGEFVPQYMRAAPFFWGLVVLLSGLVTWFVGKVVLDAKP